MSPTASRKSPKRTKSSPRTRSAAKSVTAGSTVVGTRRVGAVGAVGTASTVLVAQQEETPQMERTTPRSRSLALKAQEEAPQMNMQVRAAPTYELLLAANGYLPIRKILTYENGETVLRYIKAVNGDNNTVYVIPDVDGVSVMRKDDDVFRTLEEEPSEIPYSVKTGALQCTDNVCSALIECGKNQVCMVGTDETTHQPIEKTLIVSSDEKAEINDMYPYPVVRLSDIMKDRKAVNRSVEKTTQRFRQLNNELTRDGFQKVQAELYGVQMGVAAFVPAYRQAMKDLAASSAKIADLRIRHDAMPTRTTEDEQKLATLGYNIAVRSEMLSDLLALGTEMEALALKMREVGEILAERTTYIKEKYANLGKVYTQD